MNISGPFIRRPIATTLLSLALLLGGIGAYTQLPVAPLPRVDFPTVNVNAGLPGASPETMASAVATPLERRFGRIAGITEITSSSTLGSTSLTLQFDLDRDVEAAARDVQAAIQAASADLPQNLPTRPRWQKVNPADAPIMILSLRSDTMQLGQVFDTANTVLAQKIAQVNGVGQVFVGGGQQPAVRVQIDPQALAASGLGLDDVRNTLSLATVEHPKGQISGNAQALSIAANDQLSKADSFRQVILAYRNGAPIRLGDVARVIDDVENNRLAAWVDGKRAVLMIIRRQPGANIIQVIERIKTLLPDLTKAISPAIDVQLALDRSQTIRASVEDVEFTLLLSVGLVVLVVFLFLRSGWATSIPSVAVPLALVGTFGAMYLIGYSIDNLSLMALTISTGFVVDDAIVVTENIARYIEEGDTPLHAAFKGARQIGFTIVSITVSLLAVFIPILLMGGVIGRLFREFAVVLSVAIAMSAVVSLTLTPMMASRLLRSEKEIKHGRLWHFSERVFTGMVRAYDRSLTFVLRHEALTLILTVVTVAFSVYLYVAVPKGLFPQQDTGQIVGFSDAPQDISFAAMKERQEALIKIVGTHPAVNHYAAFIGGGPGGSAGNTGSMFIELKPIKQRKKSADQIINELRPKLTSVPGINLFLQSQQDVRIGGRLTRTQYQYTLQDADLDELLQWAPRIVEKLRGIPQLRDVATDQQTNGLQLNIDVDRDTAGRMGITSAAVDDALYSSFGQRQVATIYSQLNQYRVILETKPEFQSGPDKLDQVYVKGPNAPQPVPLSTFARFRTTPTSLSVNHQSQFPSVTISFNLAPGSSLSDATAAIARANRELGVPAGLHAAFQGSAQAFQESLKTMPLLILAALFTVYIVLGVLYESYVHPITILSTLPSAGVGALLALLITKTELSIIALIGIILLIGIVKKNAIMMIDFAIEAERDHGKPPKDAIHEACLLRFRPIMMTTMAALLGAVPLALGRGAGSELRQPLGITIVGGLIISQMLTLFTTPVIYLWLDRLTKRRPQQQAEPAATAAT